MNRSCVGLSCLLAFTAAAGGCALVTHDLGSTHGPRPAPGAAASLAIVKNLGPELRSDNPSAQFLDPIDNYEDRLEISKFDDHEICVSMIDYQIPNDNVFASNENPLQAHTLTLETSDGQSTQDPVLSELGHEEPQVHYKIERVVAVGHDQVYDSTGQPAGSVERTEPRVVEEQVTLHKYTGKACFATHGKFISDATKWVKLRMRAKLYANEYRFVFD